jgi:hypothetical protein
LSVKKKPQKKTKILKKQKIIKNRSNQNPEIIVTIKKIMIQKEVLAEKKRKKTKKKKIKTKKKKTKIKKKKNLEDIPILPVLLDLDHVDLKKEYFKINIIF